MEVGTLYMCKKSKIILTWRFVSIFECVTLE